MSVYDFSVKGQNNAEINLSQYRGKVLLIVNTATACGLTPQYKALQELYERYRDQGLEILDFPCNQFLNQAPGTNDEINEFCSANYHTDFPRFAKIDVNGPQADPLFVWLKQQAPEDQGDENAAAFAERVKRHTPDSLPGDIKWNFGKFLIGRDGEVAARFSPAVKPETLGDAIESLL